MILTQLLGTAWSGGAETAAPPQGAASPAADGAVAQGTGNTEMLKQELDKLKKEVAALEERLQAQDQRNAAAKEPPASEVASSLKELDQRVSDTECGQALDRLRFTGDCRFEAHAIAGRVQAHYDGMQLQNLVVKAMFAMPIRGRPPASVAEINNTIGSHYADYLQFSNDLTFSQLKQGMAAFPAAMQQQLFGMPSTFLPAYNDNNTALFTNRLRLNFDAE